MRARTCVLNLISGVERNLSTLEYTSPKACCPPSPPPPPPRRRHQNLIREIEELDPFH